MTKIPSVKDIERSQAPDLNEINALVEFWKPHLTRFINDNAATLANHKEVEFKLPATRGIAVPIKLAAIENLYATLKDSGYKVKPNPTYTESIRFTILRIPPPPEPPGYPSGKSFDERPWWKRIFG